VLLPHLQPGDEVEAVRARLHATPKEERKS
jgi:hypothetical protein